MTSRSPPSTSPLKRKRSIGSVSVTSVSQSAREPISSPPALFPIILPDIRRNPDEPYIDPPSPAPTEIIEEPVKLTNQDHVIAAKEAGVKVRDFAYQPTPKGRRDIRAPEYWSRPLDKLVIHDRYIRLDPSSERFTHGTPGKLLWGLLSTGLVTKEEAATSWRAAVEWKAYNEYVNRLFGPYPICLPRAFKKPTIAYRKRLLEDAFSSDLGSKDLRPEDEIFMSPDVPGMDDGPAHLPEPERGLRRVLRAPQSISYRTVYGVPSHPKTLPKPTKSLCAPSQPRTAESTPARPATPTPSTSTSAAGHNATVDSVHVDKRRRTSGPSAVPSVGPTGTPPATPPADPSRLTRSASYATSAAGSSRSETPPAEEPPHPLGRSLTRSRTLSRIPPESNFTSITPARDINDIHHIPGTGLMLLANEGIKMTTYFVPQLGPAPKWCSFLENLTEEMEDQTTRTAYQDYKFIDRGELAKLGLDHLVGTPALKPYMHGYFVSLELYDAARVIANPYAYAEHRERMVQEKVDKLAETRIRAKKVAGAGVKVNKALAEKVRKEEERARKREERKAAKKAKSQAADEDEDEGEGDDDAMEVDEEGGEDGDEKEAGTGKEKPGLLHDPRFAAVFEDPEFEVDQTSREFALLNPSTVAQRQNREIGRPRGKTAVEEEEDDSDKSSSDPLSESDDSENDKSGSDSEDSDNAGKLWQDDIPARLAARNTGRKPTYGPQRRDPKVRLVPLQAHDSGSGRGVDKNATFGQRRSHLGFKGKQRASAHDPDIRHAADGGMEMTFVPKTSSSGAADYDDDLVGGRAAQRKGKEKGPRRKGVEVFGAGMERGGDDPEVQMPESERSGRTKRRQGMRSGSRNTFRRM